MARRFERAGRRLDRELDRIIRVLDTQVRPAAQKRSARLLAAASRALDQLAKSLEAGGPAAGGAGRRGGSRRGKKASR